MASTFFGLNIAYSGLSAYQTALNTTSNNISNSQTDGYSKQVANRVASAAIRTGTAYGTMGTGVKTVSVTQTRNEYYDTRYWTNQSSLGLYETRLEYALQIENYFLDDGETVTGFSSILDTMFNNLSTLITDSSDTSVRQQFISGAQDLATYFNSVYEGLSTIQNTVNEEIKSTVQEINAIAEKISLLNKQINIIEVQGGYANELRDQRALLVDELSKIVDVEVTETAVTNTNYPEMETGGTYYTIKVGGQLLVDTYDYNTLECVARENKINQCDNEGLYDIKWSNTGNTFYAGSDSMSGTLKALFDIRDGNNDEYLNGVARVTSNSQVTMVSPSIDTIEALSISETGVLTINGREYNYDGFTYETDEDGNITSYTFNLEEALTDEQALKVDGMQASVGTSVDYMGVPYYMAQMNEFLRSFCEQFNDILKSGEDLNGTATDYYAFFTAEDSITGDEYVFEDAEGSSTADTYYKLTAGNVCVSAVCMKDPSKMATTAEIDNGVDAYDLLEDLALLKSDVVLFRGGTAEDFLKCMYSDVSIDASECKTFYDNYYNISETIETLRMSVSGVDEDEEALDMIRFQNAYNLSSKMFTVLTEIYDKLIEETGV